MQRNPLIALTEWYDTLAPELQETIAFGVLIHLPGVDSAKLPHSADEFIAAFRGFLVVDEKNTFKVAGTALTFRGLIAFACKTHFNEPYWEEVSRYNLRMGQHFREEGHGELAAHIEKGVEEMPLRGARWLKAGETWKTLCENELSDAALVLYNFEHLIPQLS